MKATKRQTADSIKEQAAVITSIENAVTVSEKKSEVSS